MGNKGQFSWVSRGTSLVEHEFVGVFSLASFSMISKLFLQIHCIKYWFLYLVLSWDFCIMNFAKERRLPTRWKRQYNTDSWSNSFHIDREHSLKKVRLKWSYLKRFLLRTNLKIKFQSPDISLTSQFSPSSRWCGTSCSSNISQTCYCLQVQCFAKKKIVGFFLELRTWPSEQIGGKWTGTLQANYCKCLKPSFFNLELT